MKKAGISKTMLLVGCILLQALAMARPLSNASAKEDGSRPSSITILHPESFTAGITPVIHVELLNEAQRGLPNKVVILYLDGEQIRRIRTDDFGKAEIKITRELSAGTYYLEAFFIGTHAYLPSRDYASLTISPAVLTIETIPALPGMKFTLDGNSFESQANGIATISVPKTGKHTLEALVPLEEPDQVPVIEFERWGDDTFYPVREVEIKGDQRYQVGFALSYPVSQTFIDLGGAPVEEERIDTLTIKSSFGVRFTFEDGSPRLLQANRVMRRDTGLEATQVQYSVESVIIDGTNVVNNHQQRFLVKGEDLWTIKLLLYYATIHAQDAILGFATGDGILLEYPDGRIEELSFDENKSLTVGPLARGLYRLKVTGVSGMAPNTPLALSRNQNVDLKVLSILDMGLGMALGMVVALGLLLYGRPKLVRLPGKVLSSFRPAGRKFKDLLKPQKQLDG